MGCGLVIVTFCGPSDESNYSGAEGGEARTLPFPFRGQLPLPVSQVFSPPLSFLSNFLGSLPVRALFPPPLPCPGPTVDSLNFKADRPLPSAAAFAFRTTAHAPASGELTSRRGRDGGACKVARNFFSSYALFWGPRGQLPDGVLTTLVLFRFVFLSPPRNLHRPGPSADGAPAGEPAGHGPLMT